MSLFSPYVLIAIVVAVLGAYGGGRVQQYTRDQATFQKKIDKMISDAAAAKAKEEARLQKIATDEAAAAAIKEATRARQMVDANARIKNLSAALAATRVADVAGVLNRTIGDQADPAAAPAKPDKNTATVAEGADTTIGLWAQWSTDVVGLYTTCRDTVIGWNKFYGGLRGAQ